MIGYLINTKKEGPGVSHPYCEECFEKRLKEKNDVVIHTKEDINGRGVSPWRCYCKNCGKSIVSDGIETPIEHISAYDNFIRMATATTTWRTYENI